jgi:predicted nucleic acid-binding protein
MTVHLDTSALIDALTGRRRSLPTLLELAGQGHRLSMSTLVLYEWLRGPRTQQELEVQEEVFAREAAIAFGPTQAAIASQLYKTMKNSRHREIDLAIAACALSDGAALWTLNRKDFDDVPTLTLV